MAESDVTSQVEDLKVTDENATFATIDAEEDDQIVDPWNVETKSDKGVDYDKLISKLICLLFKVNKPGAEIQGESENPFLQRSLD